MGRNSRPWLDGWNALLIAMAFICFMPQAIASEFWAPLKRNVACDVCYGKGRFVATCRFGNALWSTDGHRWWGGKSACTGTYDYMYSVCFGNDQFLAVGRVGKIMRSSDGKNWTAVVSPTTSDLFDVTFADGKYMAVGNNTAVFSSPDGVNWSGPLYTDSGPYPPIYGFSCVGYGNGVWLAVEDGNSRAIRSVDGISWSRVNLGASYKKSMIFDGAGFVLVGEGSAQSTVTTSNDGLHWSSSTAPEDLQGIAHHAGTYVALGKSGTLHTSTDLRTWQASASAAGLSAVTYGNGCFSAIGRSYTATSPDGRNWTVRGKINPNGMNAACWFKESFVVVGDAGFVGNFDGRTQIVTPNTPATGEDLIDVATDGNHCVAVGNYGSLVKTMDGLSWVNVTPPDVSITYGIKRVLGSYVAYGSNDAIHVSANGGQWTTTKNQETSSWNSIASDGTKALLIGGSRVRSSTDLVNWTSLPNSPVTFYDVDYGNGVFVATAYFNGIYTSNDGRNWTAAPIQPAISISGVRFVNGRFIVASASVTGRLFVSIDGKNWTEEASGVEASSDFGQVAYGGGIHLSVGDFGQILMSSRQFGNEAPGGMKLDIDSSGGISLRFPEFSASGGVFRVERSLDMLTWDVIANDVTPDGEGFLFRGKAATGVNAEFFRAAPVN